MTADPLVEDYLRRLEASAANLSPGRRAELVLEIREHIDHALVEAGDDPVAVRNVLERLGPTEEIVAAAEPEAARLLEERSRRLELAALAALLIPFVGWVVGSILVVISRLWSSRDKGIGLGLLAAAVALPVLAVLATSGGADDSVPVGTPVQPSSESNGTVEVFAFLAVMLAGLPSAVFLGWRLSSKTETR